MISPINQQQKINLVCLIVLQFGMQFKTYLKLMIIPNLKERLTIVNYGIQSNYVKQLRFLVNLDDDFSYKRGYEENLLTSSLRTKHTLKSEERFDKTLPGKIEPISRFLRLDRDSLCNTLRAGTPSSRGAHTSPPHSSYYP